MPPKGDKKKDAGKSATKDKDPVNKSRGKAKKKMRYKGKVRDRLSNLVLFDKLCEEVPNYELITPAVVSERRKIRGSWPEQPFRNSLVKDWLNWFQSTERKWFTPETPRVEMPQLLVKMHEQVPPAVHFEK